MGPTNSHNNPETTRVSGRRCGKATLLERGGLCIHNNSWFLSLFPDCPSARRRAPAMGSRSRSVETGKSPSQKSCPKYANILQLGKEEVPGLGQSRQAGVNQQRWATRCSLESGFIQEGCRAWPGLRSGSPLGSREGQRVLPLLLPTPPEGFPHAQVSEQPT